MSTRARRRLRLLAPEEPEYLVDRAKIFKAAGEHEKALADLDRVIALDPDRNDLFHARAMVLVSLGERAKAIEVGASISEEFTGRRGDGEHRKK